MSDPAKLPGEAWRGVVDGDLLAVVETPNGYAVRWWQDSYMMPARWREDVSRRQTAGALGAALGAERAKANGVREACAAAVQALAEDPHGDLGHDWNGGWEAAIEEAVLAIRKIDHGIPDNS